MTKSNSFKTILILQKLRHRLCVCTIEELKWLSNFIYGIIEEKMSKPRVDIYLDEEKNDTNIEFYINPERTFSISIDTRGNIDWAYLWGEYKDCGHGELNE